MDGHCQFHDAYCNSAEKMSHSHPNLSNSFCFESSNDHVSHHTGVGPSNFKSLCLPSASSVRPSQGDERNLKINSKSKKRNRIKIFEYLCKKFNKVFVHINKNETSNMKTSKCKSFSNSFLDNISNSVGEDFLPESRGCNLASQPLQAYPQQSLAKVEQDNFSNMSIVMQLQKENEDKCWNNAKVTTDDKEKKKLNLLTKVPKNLDQVTSKCNLGTKCEMSTGTSLVEGAFISNKNSMAVRSQDFNSGKKKELPFVDPTSSSKIIQSDATNLTNSNSKSQKLVETNVNEGAEKSLARELREIAKYGWYWGPITRSEAEEKLIDQPDGSFLLRDSSDARHLLSLSFKSFGKTLHTRIEHSNGLYGFYPQPDQDSHKSLTDLIDHCIMESDAGVFCYSRPLLKCSPSFPVWLTKPVSRFTQVRSLQYLCRFVIRQYTSIHHIQTLPLPSKIKGYLQQSYF